MSTFQAISRKAIVRHDPGEYVGIRVVDRNDRSPAHSSYPTGYDSRCGYCWLGGAHSVNYHTQEVSK